MDNKPTHHLYNVVDQGGKIGEEKSGIWTRIGAAWPHADGKGYSIKLDIPLVVSHETRLVLRTREEAIAEQEIEETEEEEIEY